METLRPDDKNIEYRNEGDLLVDVYFNGEKFTGTLKDHLQQIDYKNGVVDGQLIEFFETGELRSLDLYDNGQFICNKKYYKNGNLNSETISKPYSYKVWNMNSRLIREENTFYYINGQQKKIYGGNNDSFSVKAYNKTEEVIYVIQKEKYFNGEYNVNIVEYNNVALYDSYFDLLIEENPELADTEEKNDTHQIWMWFWTIFEKDKSKYLEIVNELMTHSSKEVIGTVANIIASHKYHNFVSKETLDNSECYKLIREYTISQDKYFPGREIREFFK